MNPTHTPISIALEWFEASARPDVKFSDVLTWFLAHGTVYSDAHTFLLARPWQSGVGVFDGAPRPDTWLIYLASTNGVTPLRRFLELAPFPLPNVAYQRRGELRVYSWNRLEYKLRRNNHGINLRGP